MNREIKFRAWDVEGNQFWDDSLGDWKIEFLSGKEPTVIVLEETFSPYGEQEFYWRDVEKTVIQQYTGLKDKNGKEIYEGDIVEFSIFDYNGSDTQYKGVVKYQSGLHEIWKNNDSEFFGSDGAFILNYAWLQDDEFEVIGNIYENPELIEGGK